MLLLGVWPSMDSPRYVKPALGSHQKTNLSTQVANAQQTELALASSLTGDATIDVATIRSLLKMFQDGTKQNMQNLLDVSRVSSSLASCLKKFFNL